MNRFFKNLVKFILISAQSLAWTMIDALGRQAESCIRKLKKS